LTILYLVFVEIVKVHRLCAWCTGVHALVLATFLIAISLNEAAPTPAPAKRTAAAKANAAPVRTASVPAASISKPLASPAARPAPKASAAVVAPAKPRSANAHGKSSKHRAPARHAR